MNTSGRRMAAVLSVALAAIFASPAAGQEAGGVEAKKPGEAIDLAGRRATVVKIDSLPYVENEFTSRFTFDTYENPKLRLLRQQYDLDKVTAPGRTDFEKQLLLLTWAHERFDFGDPQGKGGMRNALEILELAKGEQKFFCVQHAAVLLSAAASMGYVCRSIGHATHSWNEIWSAEHRKWVLFDPTPGAYAVKDGAPVNTYEARAASFEDGAKGVAFVNGKSGRASPKSFKFANFSIGTSTNWLDSRPAGSIRIRDKWSGGDANARPAGAPTNPGVDLYFPIHQAALGLEPQGGDIKVTLRTMTPNFKAYRVRIDGRSWADSSSAQFVWKLHPGKNLLEAKAVNKFDVEGSVSTAELLVSDEKSQAAATIIVPAVSFVAQGGGRVNVIDKEAEASPSYVHLWNAKGHWLEWTVENAAGGEYDLWLRYAARYPAKREVKINGLAYGQGLHSAATTGMQHPSAVANEPDARAVEKLTMHNLLPTDSWTTFRDYCVPVRVTLTPGRNVVRLTNTDGRSVCLSRLKLTSGHDKDIVLDGIAFSGQGAGEAQKVVSDGGGFFSMWDAKGHWLEWNVAAPVAGEYDVYLHYASLGQSPRELKVNGEIAKGLESCTLKPSGGWRFWVEGQLPARVTLKQGQNVLRLTNVEGKSLNLAGIRLVGPDKKDILVPATSFTAQGGGQVRAEMPSRHGYINLWNEKDHWLEWNVISPAAGDYSVTLRYATKVRSPRQMLVNGETVKGLESFTLDPTGEWRTWRESTLLVPVTLRKGANVVRLTSLGGGGFNLDEIQFVPASVK